MSTGKQNNRNSVASEQNSLAWDRLARDQVALAKPAEDEVFGNALAHVDPLGWLGGSIVGRRVLCLAAGGGKHSALYAAAGAEVTVVDVSKEMLALDREVASARGFDIQAVLTSMDDLTMLPAAGFDIVIHPVSTCYLPDVPSVFVEVSRVIKPGGLYVSQHKSPVSLQCEVQLQGTHYRLQEPYYRDGPLPADAPSRIRERGTLEFLHRLEELIGGICRAGFVIEDLVEPRHANSEAEPGSFGHRSSFVAPYLRIKARRSGDVSSSSVIDLA